MSFTSGVLLAIEKADALIFDMDGTLVDSMPAHFHAWTQVANEFGLSLSESRFYELGGVPTKETLEILSAECGVVIDITAATKRKESFYGQIVTEIQPIQKTVSLAKGWHSKKPMAVATGANRANATEILSCLSLLDLFGAVVTSSDVAAHKPAPDVFLEAAARLQVNPKNCVAFEDTDIGLQAIRSAGMLAVDVRE